MKVSENSFFPPRNNSEKPPKDYDEPSSSEGFAKFCQQTSLHGWAYLDSEPGFLRRVIWIIVLVAVCSASLYFLAQNSQEYINAFTVTSIESTTASLSDIIFPSIFICNVNQVSKSFLEPLGADNDSARANLLFAQFIDGQKNNLSDTDTKILANMTQTLRTFYQWNESKSFNRLSSQNCSEMIVFLEWRSNTTHKFYDSYQSITDYGACCVIVPYLDLVNETTIYLDPALYTGQMFHDIPTGAKNGIQNGLKLVLDVESYDYAYFPRGAKGFRVALSAATDQAVINQDGFYISTGTEILAALTPSFLNTSVKAVSRFTPDERDCYLDSEFKFPNLLWESGYRYSIKNCLYEAVLQNIISNCSCLPSFVKYNPKGIQICAGLKQACALKWMDLMGNEPDPDLTRAMSLKNVTLKCRQRCDLQTETMMTTTSDFPNRETFPYRAEFCFVLQKMSSICNNTMSRKTFEDKFKSFTCTQILDFNNTKRICNDKNEANSSMVQANPTFTEFLFSYAEENFAVLYIFIKDPYYTLIKKDEAMTTISFIGNAGGLVGLCMGLSFVSIFEIFYHCFNFLLTRLHRCCCAC